MIWSREHMPHSHFVRSAAIVILFVLLAVSSNSGGQQRSSPEYVREKIVRFQVNMEFKPDPELYSFHHPVGSTIMWQDSPRFVLFLGDKLDTPLEKCREVYVEKPVFLLVKIGGKYQSRGLIKVQSSPRR